MAELILSDPTSSFVNTQDFAGQAAQILPPKICLS